ncbi:hypothetical protein [Blastomonas sp.]|uniref:hypothetical protein n=1 Tax=Blastomonas sp. TaxID=1909299 RepID=UPI0035941207
MTHPNDGKEFGEGNYQANRNFVAAQEDFAADKQKVKEKAREAADALDGAEREELERAEAEAKTGPA